MGPRFIFTIVSLHPVYYIIKNRKKIILCSHSFFPSSSCRTIQSQIAWHRLDNCWNDKEEYTKSKLMLRFIKKRWERVKPEICQGNNLIFTSLIACNTTYYVIQLFVTATSDTTTINGGFTTQLNIITHIHTYVRTSNYKQTDISFVCTNTGELEYWNKGSRKKET